MVTPLVFKSTHEESYNFMSVPLFPGRFHYLIGYYEGGIIRRQQLPSLLFVFFAGLPPDRVWRTLTESILCPSPCR